ncbi:MAG: hypothetical protein HQ547_04695, partial [Candidatus Omnitrophica bacterium]|nr:hypothetical protein [Candidatus Omnitrophota bacterium]
MEWADLGEEAARFKAGEETGEVYAPGFTSIFKDYDKDKDNPDTIVGELVEMASAAKRAVESHPDDIRTFGPKEDLVHFSRKTLEGTFIDSLETTLELGNAPAEKVVPFGADSAPIAEFLNESLNALEELVKGDDGLSGYLQAQFDKEDNRVPRVAVKISSALPLNAARYYNTDANEVEFILNERFIKTLLNDYDTYSVVKYIMAERLFHELGHSNASITPLETAEEEAALIREDVTLHSLINQKEQAQLNIYFEERRPEFPSGYYFRFLTTLIPRSTAEREAEILEYIKRNSKFMLASLTDERIESMSADDLAKLIESVPHLHAYDLPHKFLLYSGPPGTGKGETMNVTFKKGEGRYERLTDRLILYHTRKPRVTAGRSEKDGVDYHFRTENTLRRLESEGKILVAWVNNQLQGVAIRDFAETVVISKEDLVDNKKGIILDDDEISRDTEKFVKLKRQINGLENVFSGDKLVVLEAGYGWFMALKKDPRYKERYEDVLAIFVSPFTDEEIDVRARNAMWVDSNFSIPAEKAVAYREMMRIIREKEEEIDLSKSVDLRERIKEAVKSGTEPLSIAAHNARAIEDQRFLEDLEMECQGIMVKIKAMAYETNRRLSVRDGEIMFSYSKESDPKGYDRYQRVLEGVRQLLTKNQYDEVLNNPWGWTPQQKHTILKQLADKFCRRYFIHIVKALRDTAVADLRYFAEPAFDKTLGKAIFLKRKSGVTRPAILEKHNIDRNYFEHQFLEKKTIQKVSEQAFVAGVITELQKRESFYRGIHVHPRPEIPLEDKVRFLSFVDLKKIPSRKKVGVFSGPSVGGKGAMWDVAIKLYPEIFTKLMLYADHDREQEGAGRRFRQILKSENEKLFNALAEYINAPKNEKPTAKELEEKHKLHQNDREALEDIINRKDVTTIANAPRTEPIRDDEYLKIPEDGSRIEIYKEFNGVTYRFVSPKDLEDMAGEGTVIRETIQGKYGQGLSLSDIEDAFVSDTIFLLEGDRIWFEHVKERYPECPTIFVSPFSTNTLGNSIQKATVENTLADMRQISKNKKECVPISREELRKLYLLMRNTSIRKVLLKYNTQRIREFLDRFTFKNVKALTPDERTALIIQLRGIKSKEEERDPALHRQNNEILEERISDLVRGEGKELFELLRLANAIIPPILIRHKDRVNRTENKLLDLHSLTERVANVMRELMGMFDYEHVIVNEWGSENLEHAAKLFLQIIIGGVYEEAIHSLSAKSQETVSVVFLEKGISTDELGFLLDDFNVIGGLPETADGQPESREKVTPSGVIFADDTQELHNLYHDILTEFYGEGAEISGFNNNDEVLRLIRDEGYRP